MTDITAALREARKDLLDLGYNDHDAPVHAINVCILEREASPVHVVQGPDESLTQYNHRWYNGDITKRFEASDVRAMVVQEWHKIVKEHGLKPGTTCEQLVSRLLKRIDGI